MSALHEAGRWRVRVLRKRARENRAISNAQLALEEGLHRSMTRLSVFNSPLLLGFDHFERTLDRISKQSAEGYPPYNIEQIGEDRLRITLAVAGFALEELEIQLEANQLTVRGRQEDEPGRIFLHRGIAARQFQRSFVLAEGVEVTGANLDNGLLNIELRRPTLENQVRQIVIQGAAAAETRKVATTTMEPSGNRTQRKERE
jgi:HSP20 family molecular chaperone IbpA